MEAGLIRIISPSARECQEAIKKSLTDLQAFRFGKNAIDKTREMIESMSAYRGVVTDEDLQIQQLSASFQSIPELIMTGYQLIAAASDIPASRFFGSPPGGLSTDDRSGLENYYNNIAARQRLFLDKRLEQIEQLILNSVFGRGVISHTDIVREYKPLWNLSDLEKADIRSKDIQNVLSLEEGNLITRENAIDELMKRESLLVQPDVDDLEAEEQMEQQRQQMLGAAQDGGVDPEAAVAMAQQEAGQEAENKKFVSIGGSVGQSEQGDANEARPFGVMNDRWITYHPNGDDGKGRHLMIDDNGTIKKGPMALIGAKPSEIGEKFESAPLAKRDMDEALSFALKDKKRITQAGLLKAIRENKGSLGLVASTYGHLNFMNNTIAKIQNSKIYAGEYIENLKRQILMTDEERAKIREKEMKRLNKRVNAINKSLHSRTFPQPQNPVTPHGYTRQSSQMNMELYPSEIKTPTVTALLGPSMDKEKADGKNANPLYDPLAGKRHKNCRNCVFTYAMRRRGYDVQAGELLPEGKERDEYFNTALFLDDNGKPAKETYIPGTIAVQNMEQTKAIVKSALKELDDGTYYIKFKYTSKNYGHIAAVERKNKVTTWVDPQTGYTNTDIGEALGHYMYFSNLNRFFIQRIDNLQVNPKILQYNTFDSTGSAERGKK